MTDKISKADQIRALREANAAPARNVLAPRTTPARKPPAKPPTPKPAPAAAAPANRARRKRGRPLIEDRDKTLAAQKPWEALGMSRSSWYRRNPGAGPT